MSEAEDWIINHYVRKQIWKKLGQPHHQIRFDWGAKNAIGETFADIGCVLGDGTSELARRKPGKWTGVDVSERGIAMATEKHPELTFLCAKDLNQLPVGMFDTVFCSEVLEHVEYDMAYAKSLLRLAKKRLLITTPHRYVNDPGHLRIYTDVGLRRLFEPAAITIEKVERYWFAIVDKA